MKNIRDCLTILGIAVLLQLPPILLSTAYPKATHWFCMVYAYILAMAINGKINDKINKQ